MDILKDLKKACEVGDAHALKMCLKANLGISVFALEVGLKLRASVLLSGSVTNLIISLFQSG
jgi:flagellar biosynthesis protein FliQ